MKLKNMYKKIVALVCVAILFAGVFSVPSYQVAAATDATNENGYDLIMLSELTEQYEPGNVTRDTKYTKCKDLTLDRTTFEGAFQFTGIGEGANLIIMPDKMYKTFLFVWIAYIRRLIEIMAMLKNRYDSSPQCSLII